MRTCAFELWHPVVPAIYCAGTIALAMFGLTPACVALTFAAGFTLDVALRGLRDALGKLRWQLPLLLLICVVNPLYSATGSTLIGRIGPFRIYAESLAYGATMGALLVAVLFWFEAAADALGPDEIQELSSRALPTLALAFSMVLRLVPHLMQQAREMRGAWRATRGNADVRSWGARLLSALFGSALEDSVVRADSMRARGWGTGMRRSSYASQHLSRRDVVALGIVCVLEAAAAWGIARTTAGWRFYPRMRQLASPLWLLPYALLLSLPHLVLTADYLRFGVPHVREP